MGYNPLMRAALTTIALFLTIHTAHAETIAGRASVIDGDTLEIHGERIRILDIDAPESRQTCTQPDGTEWRCGQKAALAVSDWIAQRQVTCETSKKDMYDRWLARCATGSNDLGKWMAVNGWAVPYRDCKCEVIRDAAKAAKLAKVGIWSGTFVMPWDWRAQHNKQATTQPLASQPTVINPATPPTDSTACQIKGNINSKGERIYHMPGGRWYDETKISPGKGERWFCSEAEAKAAGWRAAR
jgi:endonuclease YncB( thermonuclease family)